MASTSSSDLDNGQGVKFAVPEVSEVSGKEAVIEGESGSGGNPGTTGDGSTIPAQTPPTKSSDTMPSTTSTTPPPPTTSNGTLSANTSPANNRLRSVSNATSTTSISTADSAYSTATVVPSKRQRDFEKLFGPQLRPFRAQERPDDFLTVLQTQSADLQASVLLHGRLYLTAYYLCFRSNIVGYITEKMYDLRDILVVERSTTAKWIQNAVSLTVLEDNEEVVVGYGSMGDREAMYEGIVEVWKVRAPERWEAFERKVKNQAAVTAAQQEKDKARAGRSSSSASRSSSRSAGSSDDGGDGHVDRKASINTIRPDASALGSSTAARVNGAASASTPGLVSTSGSSSGKGPTPPQPDVGRHRAVSEVRHTQASGEGYEQLALDTKIGVPMDQLFNLMYHNEAFQLDFMEKRQKLTDVKVTQWSDVGGKKERRLTSVMHMNNMIGPKKSDCNSTETIQVEDPDKAYEVVSETQTPDIPSGKSFKIRTRTCMSHTGLDNDSTPATRLYCTTQCDWSSSSMLKSTITPAVIKGQKDYHATLVSALKDWIEAHPEDFEAGPPAGSAGKAGGVTGGEKGGEGGNAAVLEDKADEVGTQLSVKEGGEGALSEGMSFTTILAIVCALSLALNLYLLTRRC